MREKIQKIATTFRIDPVINKGAKKLTLAAKQTLSRHIEHFIKLDL